MKNTRQTIIMLAGLAVIGLSVLLGACRPTASSTGEPPVMLTQGKYPYATFFEGRYFFTSQPAADTIYLTATERLEDIAQAKPYGLPTPPESSFISGRLSSIACAARGTSISKPMTAIWITTTSTSSRTPTPTP